MKWVKRIGAALAAGLLLLVGVFFVFARFVPMTVPAVPPDLLKDQGGLKLQYLGVSGYSVTDGKTVVLLDPTPTRPPPSALLTGPLEPDEAWGAKICPVADFILVNHTHYDHALDVPAIALRTKATVVGSQNTVNLALSRGVPKDKTRVVKVGDRLELGTFVVDVRGSRHTDIAGLSQPMDGVIPTDAGKLWFWQYALDETLSYRLAANATTVWFHPTSTYAQGELGGLPAPTLIVGVTGEKPTREKVEGLVAEAKPVRVLPTHYDNFFQPMQNGLSKMPGFDLDPPRALFQAAVPNARWITLDYDTAIFLPPD